MIETQVRSEFMLAYSKTKKGFTLLELSIVMVIIGLIVGGVLVGRDLIKATELRATIRQVDKLSASVNTFRTKFNALPGDITRTQSSSFGLLTLGTSSITGMQDGNGLIEAGIQGNPTGPSGETLLFWRHLSDAGLIDGQFGLTGNSLIATTTGQVTDVVTQVEESLPSTKLTPVNSIIAYSSDDMNYFQLLPIILINSQSYTAGQSGLTPIDAFNIDVKLDNGMPMSGTVQARAVSSIPNELPTAALSTTPNVCTSGSSSATDTSNVYNRNASLGGNNNSCSLRFRFN